MMEDELQKAATRRRYEQRQGIVQEALTSTLANDRAVEAVLQSKGKQQEQLIGKLLEDEKYQKEAFSSLLLQQDSRSQVIYLLLLYFTFLFSWSIFNTVISFIEYGSKLRYKRIC